MLGTCRHIHTKYEVPMSNPVTRWVRTSADEDDARRNDGQSMIV